ncbi:NAD(P)-dependent alcohol dehydrogenase [Microbacterium sp. P07]|uniref:NAD(P)-dependent alcohol dehydrogenase n=1 Tax=Microbacterium sp. P07 TaxID=3366952 RepID=UPI003747258A
MTNIGYAATSKTTPLAPYTFQRGPVGAEDVRITIEFCGVCHSDVHQARDEFGGALGTQYPCMPGHEIVGTVAEIGAEVTRYTVGDRVGVGCMVFWGSEQQRGVVEEQYQVPPPVFTYNAADPDTGEITFGGYSDEIVVNEHFVLRIPESIPSEQAAPLLCAGVTTWSPMEHWNVGPGHTVAIAGIGGLGHVAVKLAKARGADRVIALTTTAEKKDEILALGADEVILMTDDDALEQHAGTVDFLLTTIPTPFDFNPYIGLLAHDGALVTVGMLEPIHEGGIDFAAVAMKRATIASSMIGSITETQEVLDFAAEHGTLPDVEIIPIQDINATFDRIVDNDARFRYVIDIATLASDRT